MIADSVAPAAGHDVKRRKPLPIGVLFIAEFVAYLLILYPGFMTDDLAAQLLEARSGSLSDWHPPLMGHIWRALDAIILSPTGMLIPHAVHRIGGAVAQSLAGPLAVVESEVLGQPEQKLRQTGIALEVDVLVLNAAPQALDDDVVQGAATSVHADGNPLAQQDPRKRLAGELRTLNTSGLPWARRASSRQSTQNPASRVLEIRQASTRRAYQSMTATR
jgi:hypothetical protein